MKRYLLQWMMVIGIAVTLTLALGNGDGVWAQNPGDTVYITNPAAGAVVSGLVTITGAAAFPDFLKYEILLKPGKGDSLWVATVYSPVVNGNLARWDTRTYQNGSYQMLIRQVHNDSNYIDFTGPTVIIDNSQGAPLPYPEIESSYLYPPEQNALARVRNCGHANLKFDYMSPVGFHSAGDLSIKGREGEYKFCPFEDFILIPGEYRGTAAGEGEKPYTYLFQAEAGKIYEITYNGRAAGRNQLVINVIEGDERASGDTGSVQVAVSGAAPAVIAPAPAVTNVPVAAEPAAPMAAPAETKSILPVTGQSEDSKVPFVAVGAGLVLLLIVGGVVAVRRRGFSG